jgi:hypothetical protein
MSLSLPLIISNRLPHRLAGVRFAEMPSAVPLGVEGAAGRSFRRTVAATFRHSAPNPWLNPTFRLFMTTSYTARSVLPGDNHLSLALEKADRSVQPRLL